MLTWWLSSKDWLPAQEMRIQPLGQEGGLEREMAAHSTIPAWRILWTGEPGIL